MSGNDEIEIAARRLRIKLSIDDQTRPDMPTVVFKMKDSGMIRDYIRVPDHEMPDDEARYDSFTKLLYLRESTFCAANSMFTYSTIERRRARYTIAHEVGHIALGHNGTRFRGNTAAATEKIVQKIRRQESDANIFAAAFLAPAHLA